MLSWFLETNRNNKNVVVSDWLCYMYLLYLYSSEKRIFHIGSLYRVHESSLCGVLRVHQANAQHPCVCCSFLIGCRSHVGLSSVCHWLDRHQTGGKQAVLPSGGREGCGVKGCLPWFTPTLKIHIFCLTHKHMWLQHLHSSPRVWLIQWMVTHLFKTHALQPVSYY